MLKLLYKAIAESLTTAQRPAVFVSFGKDSLLLLHLVRKINPDIPVYYFSDELSSFAADVIQEQNLTVMSYPPADRYLVPNGEGLALIDEYSIGNERVPVVSPIVAGENCKHGVPELRMPYFPFAHDVVFWGMKQGETCEAVGTTFEREIQLGHSKFIAPLYEMTDRDVYEALETLEIDYPEKEDEMELCNVCLDAIINSDWDQEAALAGFRQKFQFGH